MTRTLMPKVLFIEPTDTMRMSYLTCDACPAPVCQQQLRSPVLEVIKRKGMPRAALTCE